MKRVIMGVGLLVASTTSSVGCSGSDANDDLFRSPSPSGSSSSSRPPTNDSTGGPNGACAIVKIEAPKASVAGTTKNDRTPPPLRGGTITAGSYLLESFVGYGVSFSQDKRLGERIALGADASFQLITTRTVVAASGAPSEEAVVQAGTWSTANGKLTTTTSCIIPAADLTNATVTGDYEATSTQMTLRGLVQVTKTDGTAALITVDTIFKKE